MTPEMAGAVAACRGLFLTAPVSSTPGIAGDRLHVSMFRLGQARLSLAGLAEVPAYRARTEAACSLVIVPGPRSGRTASPSPLRSTCATSTTAMASA